LDNENVENASVNAQTFESLGLNKHLLDALRDKGYTTPTPIQARAIPAVISGRDIIGQSQTGTGKTAAFALSILEKITPELPVVQALVLTPTRELALQVAKETLSLAKYTHVNVALLYGGQDIKPQINALSRGAQVVVGTPGRVLDHLQRRTLDTRHVNIVVLDEADRMLDMGFIDDVQRILSSMPAAGKRQSLLFSATMPSEILRLSQKHMNDPLMIKTSEDKLALDAIQQLYVSVDKNVKPKALAALIATEKPESAIVFCRTKRGADSISNILKGYGIDAIAMHGNLTQSRRENVLEHFRSKRSQIMVATDVAGRGLDITSVSHVFNFDPTDDAMAYVHRIGRTGRAGATGRAISFVTSVFELRELKSAAARTGVAINELKVNLDDAPPFNREAVPHPQPDRNRGRFGGRPSSGGRFGPRRGGFNRPSNGPGRYGSGNSGGRRYGG
jgi:ATP-dependent RNA helicase DeaD